MVAMEAGHFNYQNFDLGPKIFEIVQSRKISVNSLSKQVGYDPAYLHKVFHAQRPVTRADFVLSILNALDIYGYERTRLLWEAGIIDRHTLPSTISEELYIQMKALADLMS